MILALRRLGQGDFKFKASLDYIVSLGPKTRGEWGEALKEGKTL